MSSLREIGTGNGERRLQRATVVATEQDWKAYGAAYEQSFPGTPQKSCWPKKLRRFQKLSPWVVRVREKVRQQKISSCLEIEQELFHEFAPPTGPINVGDR
jgi:hypothetical protein